MSRTISRRHQLGLLAVALMSGALSCAALGQTMYKCKTPDGRVEYSSRPCAGTASEVSTLAPDAAPSQADRAAAQARVARDKASIEAREASESPARRPATGQIPSAPAAAKKLDDAKKVDDAWLNEKTMVHTSKGWEQKTRRQVIAEENQREHDATKERAVIEGKSSIRSTAEPRQGLGGRPEEKILVHGTDGWDRSTRAEAAAKESADAAESRLRQAQQAARRSVTYSCSSNVCFGSDGSTYNHSAGGTYVGPSGACQRTGNTLQCP